MADLSSNMLSRGLRDNNPLNINGLTSAQGGPWLGQTGLDRQEGIFSDVIYGIRAAAIQLVNDYNNGYTTLNTLIPLWTGNTNYAANVASILGMNIDDDLGEILNPVNASSLKALMIAMCINEIGQNYAALIPDSDWDTGIANMTTQQLFVSSGPAVQSNNATNTTSNNNVVLYASIAIGVMVLLLVLTD